MTTENDWKNALEFARELGEQNGRKKGLEEGRAEGRAEGIAEGEANGKLEAAQNMKAKGLDLGLIAECTGLSPEQIKTL